MMEVGFCFISVCLFGLFQHRIKTDRAPRAHHLRLDMGCGKGQACVDVARQSGAAVTGLDLSTSNIQRAKEFLAVWSFSDSHGGTPMARCMVFVREVPILKWMICG